MEILERWTGVKPHSLTDDEMAAQADGQQLFLHRSPQHLRL
jgi:hypothetical protein